MRVRVDHDHNSDGGKMCRESTRRTAGDRANPRRGERWTMKASTVGDEVRSALIPALSAKADASLRGVLVAEVPI